MIVEILPLLKEANYSWEEVIQVITQVSSSVFYFKSSKLKRNIKIIIITQVTLHI
jgi:hypothetical protein